MGTTYKVTGYSTHRDVIDRLITEAGIDTADVWRIDIHRWWVTFHLYRRNKAGMIYTYWNGNFATRTVRSRIKPGRPI